jgi:hypothetical protein
MNRIFLLLTSFLVLTIAMPTVFAFSSDTTVKVAQDTEVDPIILPQQNQTRFPQQQELSETQLEYLVNKSIDISLNNTIVTTATPSVPYEDQDASQENLVNTASEDSFIGALDLNCTQGYVLFTNSSVIQFQSESPGFSADSFDSSRPPASPLPVTKEGHWFPNMDHSRIRYEINARVWFGSNYDFRLDISRGEDIWARYFRIYVDGSMVHDQIIGGSGFHDVFTVGLGHGTHRIEFEIWSGYYSDYSWKMDSFIPISPDPQDPTGGAQITGEFLPFQAYGRLRWDVYMGQQTWAEVKIDNVDDPFYRDLKFFVDGVQIQPSTYAPCEITFNLGSYTHGSFHEIMIEVSWCNYMEWGYKLSKFRVSYGGAAAEIDYLSSPNDRWSNVPSADVINYIQVWYVEHGYQRYSLFIDDEINADNYFGSAYMTGEIYQEIMTNNFDNNVYGVNYILFGHYDQSANTFGWNWGNEIFIADEKCAEYANAWGWLYGFGQNEVSTVTMMHEMGHSIGICDWSGNDEQYCTNSYCVMAQINVDNCWESGAGSWYCQHHWDERNFPDF